MPEPSVGTGQEGLSRTSPAVETVQRRTMTVLVIAQIVGTVGVGVAPSIGVLLAGQVTDSAAWAGLARTASTLGAALIGLPLGNLAARHGRRVALATGWWSAAAGGALLVAAAQWSLIVPPAGGKRRSRVRGLVAELRVNRHARVAVTAILTAQAVMVAVMTMTPVHLEQHGGSITAIGLTISLHIAGMYGPSPIVGIVADRYGHQTALTTGIGVLLVSLVTRSCRGPPAYGGSQANPIDVPAYRYQPGAAALTTGLAAQLPHETLRLSTPVTAIDRAGDAVEVDTHTGRLRADHVVLAVPPALAIARIDFHNLLEPQLVRLAAATPVWMGAVVKVVATYRIPFWRTEKLAGAVLSRTGPLREIHDMSGPDGDPAALFGFAPAAAAGPEFAVAVTAQLAQLFGPQATQPDHLHVQDWSTQAWTSPAGVQHLTDYGLFGHPLYQQPALASRLHWASTETAADYAGHLEGALLAGEHAARAVLAAHTRPVPTIG